MSEEERQWERTRRAILRRNASPTAENCAAAHDQVEQLVEVMEQPKLPRRKAA